MNKRNVQVHFMVTPEELTFIHERMDFVGIINMSAYLRRMALRGHVIRHELSGIAQVLHLLGRSSSSLNQLVKMAHTTGHLYENDILGLRDDYQEIKKSVKEICDLLMELS